MDRLYVIHYDRNPCNGVSHYFRSWDGAKAWIEGFGGRLDWESVYNSGKIWRGNDWVGHLTIERFKD